MAGAGIDRPHRPPSDRGSPARGLHHGEDAGPDGWG